MCPAHQEAEGKRWRLPLSETEWSQQPAWKEDSAPRQGKAEVGEHDTLFHEGLVECAERVAGLRAQDLERAIWILGHCLQQRAKLGHHNGDE